MSQVISPSAIRAYKLSKYPAGQANKIFLEAGKAKRVTSQFMSRNGAKEAGRRIRDLKKTADGAKKVSDRGQKLWDSFTKVPAGNSQQSKASRWGGILAIFTLASVALLSAKVQEWTQEAQDKTNNSLAADLSKVLGKLNQYQLQIKKANELIAAQKLETQRTKDRVYELEKQIVPIREKSNDALYEVRQGRKIVEEKIKSTETTLNTKISKLSETYQKVRADVDKLIGDTKTGVSKQIQEIIDKIKQAQSATDAKVKTTNESVTAQSKLISEIQATIKAIKPPDKTDINKIISDVTDKVKALFNPQLTKISTIEASANKATIDAVEAKNTSTALKIDLGNLRITTDTRINALATQDGVLAGSITNLNQSIAAQNQNIAAIDKKSVVADFSSLQKKLDAQFNQFIADNNKALNVRDLQQSKLSQDFDRKLAEFANSQNLTNEQRFQQAIVQNQQALKVRDLQQSELSKKFDTDIATAINNFSKTSDQRYNDFINQNKQDLKIRDAVDQDLTRKISALERDNKDITADISKLDTKIKEQEKVNSESAKDIKQMLPVILALPAKVGSIPGQVAQQVPNLGSIEGVVQSGMCKSTAPGGCTKSALDEAVNNVNQNNDANKGDLLDKINAIGQGTDLALLGVINDKLGDKIPGGIGGKLVDGFKWLQLDRLLNILTFAATVHNAMMLSNDIGQTFLGIISNALQLIGIKDDKGNAYDIGGVINSTVENLVKGIIGAENYTELSAAWQKANRVYQATTNILNSFQGLAQSILQANELIGAYTGRIGNALKKAGAVLESAYPWMNPEPKFNRVTQGLEALQQTASTIQQVTQIPLDIVSQTTELTNAATEFTKAIKEDGKPENKATTAVEPDTIKATSADSKAISTISAIPDITDYLSSN
jgi:hypothetical protein